MVLVTRLSDPDAPTRDVVEVADCIGKLLKQRGGSMPKSAADMEDARVREGLGLNPEDEPDLVFVPRE